MIEREQRRLEVERLIARAIEYTRMELEDRKLLFAELIDQAARVGDCARKANLNVWVALMESSATGTRSGVYRLRAMADGQVRIQLHHKGAWVTGRDEHVYHLHPRAVDSVPRGLIVAAIRAIVELAGKIEAGARERMEDTDDALITARNNTRRIG